MNTRQLFQALQFVADRMAGLSKSKGEEYVGGENNDRLLNFKQGGERTGVKPLTYLFFGLDKHFNSVSTYVKERQSGAPLRVMSESIQGRLDDIILYAILAKCLIAEENYELGTIGVTSEESHQHHGGEGATTGPAHEGATIQLKSSFRTVEDNNVAGQGKWVGNQFVSERPPSHHKPAAETFSTRKVLHEAKTGDIPHYLIDDSIRSLQKLIQDWAGEAFPLRTVDTVRMKLCNHEIPELLVSLGKSSPPESIDDEIADVMILLMDYCTFMGIDLNAIIRKKMAVNATREWTIDKHGISSHIKKE